MILVVGATGDLGGRVVRHLLAGGRAVRGLVRPGSDAAALEASGVTVSRGDLTADGVDAACDGIETVVCTATAVGRLLAGRGGPSIDAVDRDGVLALVDAAERAGVERFVYVSYASPDDTQDSPIERAKAAVERRLARSPMRVVVLRPDAFHEVHLMPLGRFDFPPRQGQCHRAR